MHLDKLGYIEILDTLIYKYIQTVKVRYIIGLCLKYILIYKFILIVKIN